jgi:type IX secretion system PorP/SprF family membrane protein
MGTKTRTFILALFMLVGMQGLRGQDPHFSQFYANPLYLNPAFAGSNVCPRLVMNYRNQWPSIPGSYVTYNASFDMHFEALSGGLGVILSSDRAGEGVLTTQQASLIYSVRIRVTQEFFIKAGLQAGYFQKHLDFNRLTFSDQIDSRWGFSKPTKEKAPPGGVYSTNDLDFAAGILGFSKKFFMGFAAHHLIPVNEAFIDGNTSYLPMKLTGHLGFKIPLTEAGRRRLRPTDPVIAPNLLYMQQGKFSQMNYGLYFERQPMIFGVWYRQFFQGSDALILLVGFEYDKFKFGYSYDITVSELSTASGGAHEISMGLKFNCPQKKVRLHEISCPSF